MTRPALIIKSVYVKLNFLCHLPPYVSQVTGIITEPNIKNKNLGDFLSSSFSFTSHVVSNHEH